MSIPKEFISVIDDFLKDIFSTFPEQKENLDKILLNVLEHKNYEEIYNYCKELYPPHFFNILYQNDEIFDNSDNLCLLPGINFCYLWKNNITEKTRVIIWKYLQLILFTIIKSQNNKNMFGDTEKLFEAIDQKEFKQKIEESLEQMVDIFKSDQLDSSNINLSDFPNAEEINDHITDLLGGTLGRLAKEIAEETANDMNLDMNNITDINDVFKKLFKTPGKLMNIIKKVGDKLDEKLKSGEIKESELMEEASNIIGKMKNMKGMNGLNSLFSNMGIPLGKNINIGAMQSSLQRNLKHTKMKERLQKKLKKKKMKEAEKKKMKEAEKKDLNKEDIKTGKKKRKKKKRKKNKK